nr:hypothetical protein [Microbacterium bovistercoris]
MGSPYLYFAGERLSQAELSAACLDGHLVELGDGYMPADAVETVALRAGSLLPLLGDTLAAVHLSAAWVHGALAMPPGRHRVQRAVPQRLHHVIDRRLRYHDRRLPEDDLMFTGGAWVATPTRTLADLARDPDVEAVHAAGAMVRAGIADPDAALGWLAAAGPVPHTRRAHVLLRRLTGAGQPEVTR